MNLAYKKPLTAIMDTRTYLVLCIPTKKFQLFEKILKEYGYPTTYIKVEMKKFAVYRGIKNLEKSNRKYTGTCISVYDLTSPLFLALSGYPFIYCANLSYVYNGCDVQIGLMQLAQGSFLLKPMVSISEIY